MGITSRRLKPPTFCQTLDRDIWIDGWIYLSIQISFAISPKSLIWPGNKALLWAQEAKGMSSAASPPHFFISPCPFRMRFARHWRFALLLFLRRIRKISFAISPKSLIWPGNKALLWAQEAKGMSSAASPPHFFISPCPFRMRFARHWRFALLLFLHWRVRMDFAVLSQRKWKGLYHIEMSIRFPPQMRWGISHLCPFIFMKGIKARPGSRRSNNRRGAPQYTIARSNWESYYT
uniref:Uncharacterized protein n=1 Tax=Oryza punctata TaxID=4537 RepID=A0A0E0MN06_ORYPU